jgi:hypothetical protein
MIYFPLSRFPDSSETVVAPGAVITAEGQALVRAPGAPASGVTPSMAANDEEIFAGFAIAGVSAAPMPLSYASKVEEFIVPASGVVALAFTPVAGQLFAFNVTTGLAIASPTIVGKTITGLTAGNTVRVTYHYALSAVQARTLQGDVQPGGYAGSYVGQVGLIKRGVIFTSEFNASVNWAAATGITLAANGKISDQTGTGAIINGYVVAVPSQETPFLGIEFSAA